MIRTYQRITPALAGLVLLLRAAAAQNLQTVIDEHGISRLSFREMSLVDLKSNKGDGFGVGSYQLGGKPGWGGSDYQPSWSAAADTLTWTWTWGSVACEFKTDRAKSILRLNLTITNRSSQPLDAITIYPLGLQFPDLPQGFGAPIYPHFKNGQDDAPAILATVGKSAVALVNRDAKAPLYVGWSPSGPPNHYRLQVGTVNDQSEAFLAKALPVSRPVAAGGTDRYSLELRFGNAGDDLNRLAGDILKGYAAAWPQTFEWSDRRPIGELFLSNPAGKIRNENHPNPRNYAFIKGVDVHENEERGAFREALLAYADASVARLKSMNAQGAIVWDVEGQQYPQPDTSYIGDPSLLAKVSPEMNAVADEFFRRFTQAGLRVGITIRPQRLDTAVSPPRQRQVAPEQVAEVLAAKIRYAKQRWGCTLFYIDSDGGPDDATPPAAFRQLNHLFPDVLLIPENIWTKDYAYTAPLASFTAPYKPLHTPASTRDLWPRAFSITYIGDAPGHSLKSDPAVWKLFKEAVARGDIVAYRAWFDDQPLNKEILELTAKRR